MGMGLGGMDVASLCVARVEGGPCSFFYRLRMGVDNGCEGKRREMTGETHWGAATVVGWRDGDWITSLIRKQLLDMHVMGKKRLRSSDIDDSQKRIHPEASQLSCVANRAVSKELLF